jgi:ribosomal protein S18 acetylase RimI-like enzyme
MVIVDLVPAHLEGCVAVAASLPNWFGYPGALEGIAAALAEQQGFVALEGSDPVGFVTMTPVFEETIEITYLAVHASLRRAGIGRALLVAVREAAIAGGSSSICLLTLGPSAGNDGYKETVEFYRAMGFWRTKELELASWGGAPALVMSGPTSGIA